MGKRNVEKNLIKSTGKKGGQVKKRVRVKEQRVKKEWLEKKKIENTKRERRE